MSRAGRLPRRWAESDPGQRRQSRPCSKRSRKGKRWTGDRRVNDFWANPGSTPAPASGFGSRPNGDGCQVGRARAHRILKDENRDLRAASAEALGEIGPEAKAAIPALKEALESKDRYVRERAASALK